jgi:hypothetical protein
MPKIVPVIAGFSGVSADFKTQKVKFFFYVYWKVLFMAPSLPSPVETPANEELFCNW